MYPSIIRINIDQVLIKSNVIKNTIYSVTELNITLVDKTLSFTLINKSNI